MRSGSCAKLTRSVSGSGAACSSPARFRSHGCRDDPERRVRETAPLLRPMSRTLTGKVALVAGATRGAGRGIATALGEAGATVYCTGRSSGRARSEYDRPETIEETAERVTAVGGKGIAIQADHLVPADVQSVVDRIDRENG